MPCNPQIKAAVPEVTARARLVPMCAAKASSSSSTLEGPGVGP